MTPSPICSTLPKVGFSLFPSFESSLELDPLSNNLTNPQCTIEGESRRRLLREAGNAASGAGVGTACLAIPPSVPPAQGKNGGKVAATAEPSLGHAAAAVAYRERRNFPAGLDELSFSKFGNVRLRSWESELGIGNHVEM